MYVLYVASVDSITAQSLSPQLHSDASLLSTACCFIPVCCMWVSASDPEVLRLELTACIWGYVPSRDVSLLTGDELIFPSSFANVLSL